MAACSDSHSCEALGTACAQGYEASKNDQPIQPSVGVFNELALQRCDLLLAEAAKNNIRLILALSNWWDEQARALAR